MVWFKVDDKLHDHPKAWRAGVAAMGLWTLAGSWASDQLTDGFVPQHIAQRWGPDVPDMAARLVDAGLWFEDERDGLTGWSFHDWNAPGMQPTRADVMARREADRVKKQTQRSKGNVSLGDTPGDSLRTSGGTPTGSLSGSPGRVGSRETRSVLEPEKVRGFAAEARARLLGQAEAGEAS